MKRGGNTEGYKAEASDEYRVARGQDPEFGITRKIIREEKMEDREGLGVSRVFGG